MDEVLLVIASLWCVVIIRMVITYHCRLRRIEEVSSHLNYRSRHEAVVVPARWNDLYLGRFSYEQMLLDPMRWTYRQFYPDELES